MPAGRRPVSRGTPAGTTGVALGAGKNATLGQWVEFDVTITVTKSGEDSFTLTNAGSNLVAFSSRQGASAPQLIVSFG